MPEKPTERVAPGNLGPIKLAPRKLERRNGHAFHPIMRKGGPHEKSKKAKRAAAKRDTQRKASEWLSRSFFCKDNLTQPISAIVQMYAAC